MQHILKWFWFAKVISFVNYQIAIDLDRQVNSSGSRFLAGKRWSRGISWSRTSFQLCNQATDLLLWTRHFANHRPKQSTAAKKQEVKEEGDFPCNWNLKSKLFPISLMAPPFGRYGCLCVQSNAPCGIDPWLTAIIQSKSQLFTIFKISPKCFCYFPLAMQSPIIPAAPLRTIIEQTEPAAAAAWWKLLLIAICGIKARITQRIPHPSHISISGNAPFCFCNIFGTLCLVPNGNRW